MTTQTINISANIPANIPAAHTGILAILLRLANALHQHWTERRDRAHLMALSDAQLRDIGLGRAEIDQAVRFGRSTTR